MVFGFTEAESRALLNGSRAGLKQVTKENWEHKVAKAVALLSIEVKLPSPEKPGVN